MVGVELLSASQASRAEQRSPVDPGRLLLQLLPSPDLRPVLEVLALVDRLVGFGDLGLKIHDARSGALRIGIAGVLQDRLYIGFILVARVSHLGVCRKVIFALGKAD